MTLYEFNNLTLNDQCHNIWTKGTYIATRDQDVYRINLYHMKEFYAEVWYEVLSNEIQRTNSFKTLDALEPYIDLVKLDL